MDETYTRATNGSFTLQIRCGNGSTLFEDIVDRNSKLHYPWTPQKGEITNRIHLKSRYLNQLGKSIQKSLVKNQKPSEIYLITVRNMVQKVNLPGSSIKTLNTEIAKYPVGREKEYEKCVFDIQH